MHKNFSKRCKTENLDMFKLFLHLYHILSSIFYKIPQTTIRNAIFSWIFVSVVCFYYSYYFNIPMTKLGPKHIARALIKNVVSQNSRYFMNEQ